jgi:kynurenine formamidase
MPQRPAVQRPPGAPHLLTRRVPCRRLQGIVAVEGLDLTQVAPGTYQLLCMPAKLEGSDGAPVRCALAR